MPPEGQEEAGAPPEPPSSTARRNATLHGALRLADAKAIRRPADRVDGCVPDVRGVGLREALAHLEGAGYAVSFQGIGYVASQKPEAGTKAGPGTKVSPVLQHD